MRLKYITITFFFIALALISAFPILLLVGIWTADDRWAWTGVVCGFTAGFISMVLSVMDDYRSMR